MIQRILKEVAAEKKVFFTGAAIICIFQAATIIIQLRLHLYRGCILDAFAWSSTYFPLCVYPAAMCIMIAMTKDFLHPDRVLRNRTFHLLWVEVWIKSGIISFFLAAAAMAETLIFGRTLGKEFSVWDRTDSYCYYAIGKTMEHVDIAKILLAAFLLLFTGIWLTSVIPLLVKWFFHHYFAGILISILINLGGLTLRTAYTSARNLFYGNIYQGIDMRYIFIYPGILLLLFLIAGCFLQKRDFLEKQKEGTV